MVKLTGGLSKHATGAIGISVAILVVATLGWTAINLLGNAETSTLKQAESINSSTWGTAVQLQHRGLLANSERIYNATQSSYASDNYTMDLPNGRITFTISGGTPMYNITNNSIYSIDYRYGQVGTMQQTIGKTLVSVVAVLALLFVFLRKK